jgi:hypothetical protein
MGLSPTGEEASLFLVLCVEEGETVRWDGERVSFEKSDLKSSESLERKDSAGEKFILKKEMKMM